MQTKCIRHTLIVKEKIQRIAVCGGSGSFLLNNAKAEKADVFITADFKYHEFFDAENKIVIADIGHYESEQFTKDLIYDLLVKNFTKFAVRLSKVNTNPIKYL
jgi:putative NIF3 family GTP cyclohydrolase 1 type 2